MTILRCYITTVIIRNSANVVSLALTGSNAVVRVCHACFLAVYSLLAEDCNFHSFILVWLLSRARLFTTTSDLLFGGRIKSHPTSSQCCSIFYTDKRFSFSSSVCKGSNCMRCNTKVLSPAKKQDEGKYFYAFMLLCFN